MMGGVFRNNERLEKHSSTSSFGRSEQKNNGGDDRVIPVIVKSVCIGFAMAIIILLFISIIATFYDMSENVLNYMIIAISILCLFVVGFKAANLNEKNGLIIGIISGVLYALIVFLIGLLGFGSAHFSPAIVANLAVGGAVGGLGGVVGINRIMSKKRKRK